MNKREVDDLRIVLGREQSSLVLSFPELINPIGTCKITKLFVDPKTGKLMVEYDNTPKTT